MPTKGFASLPYRTAPTVRDYTTHHRIGTAPHPPQPPNSL
jgi:hypothetical protein